MSLRGLLLIGLLSSAGSAHAWGDVGIGLASDQAQGPQLDLGLSYSPQGWWALGASGQCALAGPCAAEGRLRLSLEVFRTVPRWSLGYGTEGFMTSLMFDRFLTRRSSLRGEIGWRAQAGFFGGIGLGVFPFD